MLLTDSSGNLDEGSIVKKELPVIDGSGIMKAGLSIVTNNPLQRTTYSNWVHRSLQPQDIPNVDISFDTTPDSYTLTWVQRNRKTYDYDDDGVEDASYTADEDNVIYTVVLADALVGIDFEDSDTYLRKETVTTPTYEYTLANQTTDGFDFTTDTLYAWVYQHSDSIGTSLRAPSGFSIGPQV